jgi:osmotically-inducible protein OsmY
MQRTDSQIKQAVLDELKWDTRVDEAEIGVSVVHGIVSLSGTVSHWGNRLAAQDAVHRVAGVLDVANDLKVKIPGSAGRTDADIAQAVRQALEWNVFVPAARIRSTVSDGFITLQGDVDTWSERMDAEKVVSHLAGVTGVANEIDVKTSQVSAHEVRKAIEAALDRRAAREASRIALEVHDGRVSLTGVVHSWVERATVIGAARGTPGVHNIEDHLRVEPYGT